MTKAPTVALRTKWVAPAQSPFKSGRSSSARVLVFLPTSAMAISRLAPRSSEPPSRPTSAAPERGRFARSSSELLRRISCSFSVTAANADELWWHGERVDLGGGQHAVGRETRSGRISEPRSSSVPSASSLFHCGGEEAAEGALRAVSRADDAQRWLPPTTRFRKPHAVGRECIKIRDSTPGPGTHKRLSGSCPGSWRRIVVAMRRARLSTAAFSKRVLM